MSALLTLRLDGLNSRHAEVTVFDSGANAGRLTIDRMSWKLIAGDEDRLGCRVRVRVEREPRREPALLDPPSGVAL